MKKPTYDDLYLLHVALENAIIACDLIGASRIQNQIDDLEAALGIDDFYVEVDFDDEYDDWAENGAWNPFFG